MCELSSGSYDSERKRGENEIRASFSIAGSSVLPRKSKGVSKPSRPYEFADDGADRLRVCLIGVGRVYRYIDKVAFQRDPSSLLLYDIIVYSSSLF